MQHSGQIAKGPEYSVNRNFSRTEFLGDTKIMKRQKMKIKLRKMKIYKGYFLGYIYVYINFFI